MRILVVEDSRDMNRLIVKTLARAGYAVDGCFNGEEALDHLPGADYDAIILDVMMPKMDGHEFLRRIRADGSDTPVLFLTARDSVADRVAGLDLGADDYLVKPFDFDELLARIRVLTRSRGGKKQNRLTLADLTLDIDSHEVRRGGEPIDLLPKEYTILEYLMRHAGEIVSRERLENQIWNYEKSGSSNNIDGYMSRLRKKLDTAGETKLLHTVRGFGWVLKDGGDE